MTNKEAQFKTIINENNGRIKRICRYYAPTREDEQDMFQEVLINIWKSLDGFRGDAQISTWIYRIAVNTSLNYAGKHYKRMKLNVDSESIDLKRIMEEEGEAEIITMKANLLQSELNQLNVIDKALMGLVIEGLSTKEIAEIIGITEPNVRVKIHRIKEFLKNKLKGGSNEQL